MATTTSEVFEPGPKEALIGTGLQQIWRDHLLVLAMLQHPDAAWAHGSICLVRPARNPGFADAGERHRELLTDDGTFGIGAVEELVDAQVLHTADGEERFRRRCLR